MNDLNRALGDISSIRRHMARSAEFRGFGPATLASTGALAVLAGALQAVYVPEPMRSPGAYLGLWLVTAILSATVIGVQAYRRTWRLHSGMADEMIRMAVEQFLPAAGAGVLLTLVLMQSAPQTLWMLPGLWQIVYSLGVFSSCRYMPRPMLMAGGWFLVTGLLCLALGGQRALNPWSMGVPYAVGQGLVAAILWKNREDHDEA